MKSVEKLRKTIIDSENEKAAAIEEAEKGLAAAQKEEEECKGMMSQALKDGDMESFLALKTKHLQLEGKIEFFTFQKSQLETSTDTNYDDLLQAVYSETTEEYRKACQECIKKIDELDAASKKAAQILSDYAGAMAFYKAYVHKLNILDGRLPDTYPNSLATRLAEKLQYQKNGMKQFCETAHPHP